MLLNATASLRPAAAPGRAAPVATGGGAGFVLPGNAVAGDAAIAATLTVPMAERQPDAAPGTILPDAAAVVTPLAWTPSRLSPADKAAAGIIITTAPVDPAPVATPAGTMPDVPEPIVPAMPAAGGTTTTSPKAATPVLPKTPITPPIVASSAPKTGVTPTANDPAPAQTSATPLSPRPTTASAAPTSAAPPSVASPTMAASIATLATPAAPTPVASTIASAPASAPSPSTIVLPDAPTPCTPSPTADADPVLVSCGLEIAKPKAFRPTIPNQPTIPTGRPIVTAPTVPPTAAAPITTAPTVQRGQTLPVAPAPAMLDSGEIIYVDADASAQSAAPAPLPRPERALPVTPAPAGTPDPVVVLPAGTAPSASVVPHPAPPVAAIAMTPGTTASAPTDTIPVVADAPVAASPVTTPRKQTRTATPAPQTVPVSLPRAADTPTVPDDETTPDDLTSAPSQADPLALAPLPTPPLPAAPVVAEAAPLIEPVRAAAVTAASASDAVLTPWSAPIEMRPVDSGQVPSTDRAAPLTPPATAPDAITTRRADIATTPVADVPASSRSSTAVDPAIVAAPVAAPAMGVVAPPRPTNPLDMGSVTAQPMRGDPPAPSSATTDSATVTPITAATPAAVTAPATAPVVAPPTTDAPVATREARAPDPIRAVPLPAAPPVTVGTTAAAGVVFGAAKLAAQRDERDDRLVPLATDTLAGATAAIERLGVTAAGSGNQPSLDMTDQRWPHAMVAHIEALRDAAADAANAADTRIRLVPDALGAIDIGVRQDGDTLHVHFTADQPQTRALLQDAQPRLAEAAEARGLKLGQASVDAGGTGANPQQRHPQTPPAAIPRRPATATVPSADPADDGRIA